MKSWRDAWRDGQLAGATASVLSAAVLAEASHIETGSPFTCLNSTSHWLWGAEAARHHAPSLTPLIPGITTSLKSTWMSGADWRIRSASAPLLASRTS